MPIPGDSDRVRDTDRRGGVAEGRVAEGRDGRADGLARADGRAAGRAASGCTYAPSGLAGRAEGRAAERREQAEQAWRRETGEVDFHQQTERGRMRQAPPRVVLVSAAAAAEAEAEAAEAAAQAWRA
jgi:hypothetical protein